MSLSAPIDEFIRKAYSLIPLNEYRANVLTGLNGLVEFESSAFFLVDPDSKAFLKPVQQNLDERCFEDYSNHYHQYDIYKREVFKHVIPQIDRASDYLDYKQWERNEHRSDFLLKNNIYHIACIQVFYEDKLVGEISLHRSHSQSDFTGEEMKALALITPHIQNSLSNQYTFQEAQTLNKVVFKALHTDDKGILILDTNLKIVFINEAAEMFISAKEKLHGQNLLESVKESCSYLKETAKRDFVMSWHITDSRNLFSNVIKLKTLVITDELTQKSYYFCEFPLTIHGHRQSEDDLVMLGKLTAKEKTVFKLLLEGKTNDQIARTLFLSIHTVKSHIKSILQKCNANSRLDLITKIMMK